MKKLFIYLFIYLLQSSCRSSEIIIRYSVEGYIFNKKNNQPIDSALVSFFYDHKNGGSFISNDTISYYTNNKGYFKIPEIKKRAYPEKAKRMMLIYSKNLKLSKNGFINDTIFIGFPNNSKYKKYKYDTKRFSVNLGAIYLIPTKK